MPRCDARKPVGAREAEIRAQRAGDDRRGAYSGRGDSLGIESSSSDDTRSSSMESVGEAPASPTEHLYLLGIFVTWMLKETPGGGVNPRISWVE